MLVTLYLSKICKSFGSFTSFAAVVCAAVNEVGAVGAAPCDSTSLDEDMVINLCDYEMCDRTLHQTAYA